MGKENVMQQFKLAVRCVDLKQTDDLEQLYKKDREISFCYFAQHVLWQPLAKTMGYAIGRHATGLRLANDYAVRFYRSTWQGETCFHMVHSAVDFVFTRTGAQSISGSAWN
jgi:hypothetical protein